MKQILFFNPKEEFHTIYFDKLHLIIIDKCLRLNKEHKIAPDEHEGMEFFDSRNKQVQACFDKVFALHKVFDDEYFADNHLNKN